MKTSTKLLLAGGATLAVGAYAYRMGVNHVQFSLDGYQPAPDGAGLLMRIKATNPNKFFGYPVPQALINVFDNNSNFLGTAINNQLQYIPANSTSFIYAVVQPNYQNLVSVILGIISSGTLPTNLIFNGLVKVGPVQIPFDTGASIGSTKSAIGFIASDVKENSVDGIYYKFVDIEHGKLKYSFSEVSGKMNYVTVADRNAPGNRRFNPGKSFDTWEQAEAYYKSATVKTMLLLAQEKFGYNPAPEMPSAPIPQPKPSGYIFDFRNYLENTAKLPLQDQLDSINKLMGKFSALTKRKLTVPEKRKQVTDWENLTQYKLAVLERIIAQRNWFSQN